MTSKDRTFVGFSPEQAAQYAKGRGNSYPKQLYEAIQDYHTGDKDVFFDVGTGPGKVVADLLPSFKRGIGCDYSVQMIEQAKKDSSSEKWHSQDSSKRTHFFVASDVDCADLLPPEELGKIDLITVAMAAHWFDLTKFYDQAAKALRPGGTLAMWTCSELFCHPSEPEHRQIQDILYGLERGLLKPYDTPGNVLSRNGYEGIALPWTLDPALEAFEESSFQRKDWDRHGIPSAEPLADGTPGPFIFAEHVSLEHLEQGLDAASMVIRWREANPDKSGTEMDAVKLTMAKLKQALKGRDSFSSGPSCSLLLMRKAQE